MKTWTIIALALAALTGCATGFEQQSMLSELQQQRPVFTENDIARIENLQPQLSFPCRVAVAPPRSWRGEVWTAEERELIMSWGEELKQKGLVSDIVLIPNTLVEHGRASDSDSMMKNLRIAAARCHADAVLLVNLVTDTDTYVNPLSILNLTIVGMWIIPGAEVDALTVMEGVLVDTRNEYVYYTGQADGKSAFVAPQMYLDRDGACHASRLEALRAFGNELCRRAGTMAAASSAPPGRRYETPGEGR